MIVINSGYMIYDIYIYDGSMICIIYDGCIMDIWCYIMIVDLWYMIYDIYIYMMDTLGL